MTSDRKMERPWFAAQPHNWSVSHLLMGADSSAARTYPLLPGERKLGWLILPPFQRPPVWTLDQKVRFIESMWAGLPIGVWVYNRLDDGPMDAWLLDGQQRVTAILEYAADAFPVHGWLYSELTKIDKRMFDMIHFTGLETRLSDEAALRDVYERLAYGGTPHDPAR